MLLKQEQTTPCEVELEIQADAEKVKTAIAEVYKEFGKYASVPGFRKGKAPRHLLEKVVDKEKVREYVIEKVMEDAYKEALEESGLEPFASGSVKVTQFDLESPDEPFLAAARVPLPPKVELGEYKGLEVDRKIHAVTDEDVDGEVQEILKKNTAPTEVTDRPAKSGDSLMAKVGEVEEAAEEAEADSRPVRMVVVGENLPDFDEGLVGMAIGETKTIDVTYPEDFQNEEMRGATKQFKVTVNSIREQVLPEVTDAWVTETLAGEEQNVSEEEKIDTVDKFRAKIRENIQVAADQMSESGVENDLVKKIVEGSTVNYPEVMLEAGIHERFNELSERLKQRQVSLKDYLAYKGISPDDLYEQFKGEESNSLVTGLALREIVEKETIEVSADDVEAEIQDMASKRQVPVETIRAYVEKKDVISEVKSRILQKKLLEFLKAAANIKIVEA